MNNPFQFASHSKYLKDLIRKYGSVSTAFPNLNKNSIDQIRAYIRSEGSQAPSFTDPLPISTSQGTVDTLKNPCGYDTVNVEIQEPEEIPDYFRGSKADTSSKASDDTTSTIIVAENSNVIVDTTSYPQLVTDFKENPYQFEIERFGWYNVDAFIEDYPGLVNIKISGTLSGPHSSDGMTIYLFCPARKFNQYVLNQNKNSFDFFKNDEGLPFFLSERVILFAVNTDKGKARYAIKEFFTKKEQVIDLEIKECSEKELLDKIKSIELEGVKLKEVKTETRIIPVPCGGKKDSTAAAPITAPK